MWADDLESVKVSQVLEYLRETFGCSRWDGQQPWHEFLMGESRKVSAWAKKRHLNAGHLMVAARYCFHRGWVVLDWWELEAHVHPGLRWLDDVRRGLEQAESVSEYEQALAEAASEGDMEWFNRLTVVPEEFREELVAKWRDRRR